MNEYAKIIRLCTKSNVFFDERPYQSTNILQVVHYSWLLKNFHLQEYKRCRQIAVKYQGVFPAGNYNWFKWNELYVLAELHAGRYAAAADLWEYITDRPEYSALPAADLEFWEITGTYLYLLAQCGKLKEKQTNQRFRIAKAANEITLRSGLCAPVLSAQFFLALADRDYSRCMDIQGLLAQYRIQNLNQTARSYYFFQILEQIPDASFNQKEAVCKALPWIKKLQTNPREAEKQPITTEIIPYEILWTYALELLNGADQIGLFL